ncbi:S8 family serine peptidase [Metabacillus fastidiosus]|uniref:S8 family serine peptidase n=1 Tax=Metabacillus fastidiosus TaxID=1458 RepID=UPI003D2662DB
MKKWHYKSKVAVQLLFSFCLFFVCIFIGAGLVSADIDSDENANSYVFVLKENTNHQDMIQGISEKYPDVKIDTISEIGMFTISSVNRDMLEEAQRYVNQSYSSIIEETSKEKSVTIKEFKLPSQPVLPIMNQLSGQQTFRITSYASTQQVQEVSNNIYDPWRWDINKVTSNGESYAIQKGNHQVKIGIVDSGLDVNHPALKDNVIGPGKIMVPGVSSMEDQIGHGTMVAGTIAANGKIKGISPEIGIVPYKVFEGYSADSSWIVKAIIEAADDDMDIINLSLGTYKSMKKKEDKAIYTAYKRAVSYASKKGSLLVASSGTDSYDMTSPAKLAEQMGLTGDAQVHMPGGLPDVVTVSATNMDNQLAFYSNYGTQVDIAAPAGDYGPKFLDQQQVDLEYMTLTTYPTTLPQSELGRLLGFDQGYEFMIGTSLAAPKVSATAALIIAEYQEKYGRKPSPSVVKTYLYGGTVEGNGTRKQLGKGLVNAKKSLDLVNR